MLVVSVVKSSLVGAFLLLLVLGVAGLALGTLWFRLQGHRPVDDEGLLMDAAVGPSLGLFALMVAFTFGQALSLESATYADLVHTRLASSHLAAMAKLLPSESQRQTEEAATGYLQQLTSAIKSNQLDGTLPVIRQSELRLRRLVDQVDGPAGQVVSSGIDDLATAVNQLYVDSAQRIPTTVFAVQTLYYVVCFVMLGYKSAEKKLGLSGQGFLVGLALLFVVVMLMAMNIGRPGLNSMLFDPLPF